MNEKLKKIFDENKRRVLDVIKRLQPIDPYNLLHKCKSDYNMNADYVWMLLSALNEDGSIKSNCSMLYVINDGGYEDETKESFVNDILPLVKKLENLKNELGSKRDELSDLMDEIGSIKDSADEAYDDMERAYDALSRYV